MSFSFNAASIENEMESSPNSSGSGGGGVRPSSSINKKKLKNEHKKTQRQPSYDFNKVNAVVDNIQNQTPYTGISEDDYMGDFKPLAPPISAGQERIMTEDKMAEKPAPNQPKHEGMTSGSGADPNGTADSSLYNNDDESRNLEKNYMTQTQYDQYYRNLMGNYPNNTTAINSIAPMASQQSNIQEPVITKLNYLIDLMEEQKSEKTDSVVEDVVLYSFLGVFVIFIVDSFVQVGKYVR